MLWVILATMPGDGATELRSTDPKKRREALRAIYLAHKDEVFGFLVKLLRDRHLAEDALQESFVRLYAASERFDPQRPLRPWLFEIVRNTALELLRRRRKSTEVDEQEPAPGEGVLPALSEQERVERARVALRSLPTETRALLLQRHGLGMKLEDLAQSYQCTERTVRNRLNAAADDFAQAMTKGGDS